MRLLVTGAAGRLGRRVCDMLNSRGHTVIGIDVAELDIVNYGAVQHFFMESAPQAVIHCAAMTNVDRCAEVPDEANTINGLGTQNIALACQRINAALCYISTNEVFDGAKNGPYLEYDPLRPINPYGYSKFIGEQAIRELLPRHYVVRTSWVFAHGGVNFLQKIYAAAQAGKPLSVVTDEIASPTYADDLAEALCKLITTERFGTYHLVNDGSASRYDFARFALDCYGMKAVPIAPMKLEQFKRASTPPPCAILRNFVGAAAGITLRPWQDAVRAFVDRELHPPA